MTAANRTLTPSMEDYLETILILQRERGVCRGIDIADRLSFSKPSVSVALKKLATNGYIAKDPEGVRLTQSGMEIANRILERHLFFSDFFSALGIDPETADHDACLIEHRISSETFNKLREWWFS
ncbi:MAG: metal-dependent transcriptional regulator [Clostridia bacterium]|nr:metal-dependent transcriptional regulator [Clostridia bacterium]